MRADRFESPTSPVRDAARRRRRLKAVSGGRGGNKNKNNYVAEARTKRGPNWGNRKNAGAPSGNANALKRGRFTQEALKARKNLREFDQNVNRIFAAIDRALCSAADPNPHIEELTVVLRQAARAIR